MKICQLCAVDFTLNFFLLPLIDGMKKKGWEVEAVCSNGPYIKDLINSGYIIKNVNIPRNLNIISILKSIYLLYRLFKKEKYDIVHTHTPIASIIARIASKLSGVPLVIYTAHGFYFHENMPFLKLKFFIIIERLIGFITDIIFTQSLEDRQSAIKFKFLPKEKIFHIGNGVDKKKFNPKKIRNLDLIKKNINIPQNSFVIGTICRLVKEKGLVEFLHAAEKISNIYENVFFLIIGERLKSDHNKSIEKNIISIKKKIGKKIIFLGNRNDIPDIIAILDLYCLPSWREGMPRSIIEAMMMGKPVLATDIRGSREEVVNEKTGIIVPIKSSLDLEKGMATFITDKKKLIKFGEEGRKRALELYDESKIVNLQIAIINKEAKKLNLIKIKE